MQDKWLSTKCRPFTGYILDIMFYSFCGSEEFLPLVGVALILQATHYFYSIVKSFLHDPIVLCDTSTSLLFNYLL